MIRDRFEGRLMQSGGLMKRIAGMVLGKPRLELEGRVLQATGRAQVSYGKLRRYPG